MSNKKLGLILIGISIIFFIAYITLFHSQVDTNFFTVSMWLVCIGIFVTGVFVFNYEEIKSK